MTGINLRDTLPKTCEVVIPDPAADAQAALPRRWWQARGCSVPAAIVTPSSEEDVVAVVRAAAESGLKIVPAGGQVGSNILVDDQTIYLDLCRLDSFSIDSAGGTVTVSGGTMWRDIAPAVMAAGFVAAWPGFLNLGVVGQTLGGGIGPLVRLKGLSADQIVAARCVVAPGRVVNLSDGDADEDRARLLSQLRGGGHGLGVVTFLTLRLHPITSLGLDVDGDQRARSLSCSAMFLEPSWEYAAALAARELENPDPRLTVHLVVMPAPPNMGPGVAGEPAAMLDLTYMGTKDDAAMAFSALLQPETAEKAVFVKESSSVIGEPMPVGKMFSNKETGHRMDMYNAVIRSVSSDTVLRHMRKFPEFRATVGAEAAAKAFCILSSFGSDAMRALDPHGKNGFCRRDRNVLAQVLLWGMESDDALRAGQKHGERVLDNARRDDRAAGIEDAVFTNNARVGVGARLVYTADGLERLRSAKKVWDPTNIFIHPFFE